MIWKTIFVNIQVINGKWGKKVLNCWLRCPAEYSAHLVDVVQHGLGPGEHLPTDGTGTAAGPVLLLQVSVESLHEGSPHVTDVTTPGLVVLVVSVHVVHQPSESPALFVANLTDTELLVILRNFPLGHLAHLPRLRRLVSLYPRPPSLPWLRLTAGNISERSLASLALNDLTSGSSFRCPGSWWCWGPLWWLGCCTECPGSPACREDSSPGPGGESLQERAGSSPDTWPTPPWRTAGGSEQQLFQSYSPTVLPLHTDLHCGAVSLPQAGVANTGGRTRESWADYFLQHLDIAVVTLLSTISIIMIR